MNVCRNIAEQISAGRLGADDIDALMQRLETERAALEGLDNIEGRLMEKGRVIAGDIAAAALIEKRNALRNVVVEARLQGLMDLADEATGKPHLGLQAATVGVNATFEGAQRSVAAVGDGIANGYLGGVVADLEAAGLMPQFARMAGDFEKEVARVLSDLNSAEPKGVKASADAKAIAAIMHKYQRAAVLRENRAGGAIRLKDGRVTKQMHDPAKLSRAGFDVWRAKIVDKLDFRKMEVAPERVGEFLRSTFDSLESGIRLVDEVSPVEKAFKGPGNLAKKRSRHRLIEFKTVDDWLDYQREFGHGSVKEAFLDELRMSGRATAMMDLFGSNPKAMLDRMKQIGERKYRSDPAKRAGFQGKTESGLPLLENLDAQMAEIDGTVNFGSTTRVAQAFATVRSVQAMAKLGGVVISSIGDTVGHAANRIYQGRSVLDAMGDAFTAPMKGIGKEARMEVARMAGIGFDGMLGDIYSRFSPAENLNGRMAKAMQLYFKVNGLAFWTDANKRGATLIVSNDLAESAAKAFDGLAPEKQRLLTIYGIDAKQWELMRLAVKEVDGNKYLYPGEIDDVRGAVFTGMTEAQQQRFRDQTKSNLMALFANEADVSIPTAGAREQAILRRGYPADSAPGIALRMMSQFKSFPTMFNTKILGRHIYGQGAKTIREQLGRGIGANLGLATLIAGTTVMGYGIMQMKAIIAGKEPREMSAKTLMAAMMQGGGLGIYGDFLFGEASRYGSGVLETLAGPGFGTIADVVDLVMQTKGYLTGDNPDLRARAIQLVKSNTPFANLFYVKGAMDYLIWYQLQEMVNPGYLRRMEKRIKKDTGQDFIVRPSDIVATGGGFR